MTSNHYAQMGIIQRLEISGMATDSLVKPVFVQSKRQSASRQIEGDLDFDFHANPKHGFSHVHSE